MEKCFKCEGNSGVEPEKLFGYSICPVCSSKLGLFKDDTIKKHQKTYSGKHNDYFREVTYRLKAMEVDYISKRIKLLHIQDRLLQFNKE